MRLSDKDKKLLVLLLLIAVLALTYYYIYTPFAKRLNMLKAEVGKLEAEYSILRSKTVQKSRLEAKLKFTSFEVDKLSKILPPNIFQDEVILILKELSDTTGVKLEDLSFTETAPVILDENQKKPEYAQQKKLLEQGASQENKKANEGSKQIEDSTGIVMEVNVKYTAGYEQLKTFLDRVINFEQKISVSDISFLNGSENMLSGNIKMSFYGFKDNTQEVPKWDSTVKNGKDNIFEPFEGYIGTIAGSKAVESGGNRQDTQQKVANISSPGDFYLALSPSSHDVPTVILYKNGKINSTIYGDGNEAEKVELHLDYKDGKYLYKYKTSYEAFPKDESKYEEFKPYNQKYMILNILAKNRLDDKDLSGANIDIYNNTPLKLIVKQSDDDRRPRTQISIKKGDVDIIDEH
ncbi:MAG: hypothetical protein AB7G87_00895 [Clostridia bacterium]